MAASKLGPVASNVPLVDDKGNPTPYFQRLLQVLLQEKAATDVTAEEAAAAAATAVQGSRLLTAGTGLTGGGNLTADRTFAIDTVAEAERVRDVMGTAIVAGTNVTVTVDDALDKITIAASGGGGGGSLEATPVKPVVANFTLENAGTATMADTARGIKLTVPTVATNIRFIRQNAVLPAAPWTLTVRAAPITPHQTTAMYGRCLILRASASGRILIYGDYSTNQQLMQRWTSYTAFSANAYGPAAAGALDMLPWMRVVNDGTNLLFSRSPDGENFSVIHTEPLATFINVGGTLDQAGFGTMMNGVGSTVESIFQSYSLA